MLDGLLILAGYTYGPLLGLFAFGIFTNYKIHDKYVWIVTSLSVLIMIFIGNLDPSYLGGYKIGYELLPLNGLLTFIGLVEQTNFFTFSPLCVYSFSSISGFSV